jgi:uncharacterized membrane protein YesL
MIRALRLLRSSLSAWYYDLFILIAANLVWLVLSLLVLPIGPATAGLFYISNECAKGEPLSFGLFWTGMRRYARLSIKLSIAIIVITILLVVNVIFYLGLASTIGQIVGIIWIYAVLFWGLLLNYPFALMVQMDNPGLLKILRNSFLLFIDNVGLTVSMSLLTLLVAILSIFPLGFLPFPFGFFALVAIFQCKCLAMLVEKYEQREKTTGRATP